MVRRLRRRRSGLLKVHPSVMGHTSVLAFLTIMMLFVPCAATVAVMKREMVDRIWFQGLVSGY
jgi:ferrous iron transport protein B